MCLLGPRKGGEALTGDLTERDMDPMIGIGNDGATQQWH